MQWARTQLLFADAVPWHPRSKSLLISRARHACTDVERLCSNRIPDIETIPTKIANISKDIAEERIRHCEAAADHGSLRNTNTKVQGLVQWARLWSPRSRQLHLANIVTPEGPRLVGSAEATCAVMRHWGGYLCHEEY